MTMVKRIHDMAFTSWPHHVRSMFLRLRIVSWRFRAIMAVHIAFLNESMNLYERYMSNLYCVKFLTRHTIGSTVIYRDMVKKGLKKDKSVIQRFNADKVLDKGDDREQLVLLSTNHLNASKKNITTIRMAAKSGILLGVVYLFYSLAFVAFLPFWMALFCIGAPFVLLTEVVGVLTIAVMQSFDPYYEKQMMEEIFQLKLKRNLKAS